MHHNNREGVARDYEKAAVRMSDEERLDSSMYVAAGG